MSDDHELAPVEAPAAAAEPPPAPVRAERLFLAVDGLLARVDGWIARWLPPEVNPLAQSGAAANATFLVAVATGILMFLWYSPSVQFAYPSLQAIHGRTFGGFVRTLHRYSSDLTMLLLLVHAARVFFARKFGGARWVAWVSGLAMLALVWFIGWTGFWLVWDQPAQQVAVTSMRLLDALPIFGEPMARLYVADRTVPSLLFFVVFFLHMLLPLGIAVGLAVHLMRVSRAKLLPPRALGFALAAGLALAALAVPAPLDAPARMAEKAAGFTVDAWYLSPLALGLRLSEGGLWLALGAGMLLGGLVPWLLGRRREPAKFQALVEPAHCHACTQCVQDCPFDAIEMVARTDGKRFPAQAHVDPLRCVGCGVCAGSCDSGGIGLAWFGTAPQEARIEAAVAAESGKPGWVALVAADIDGGVARFDGAGWARRIPGYQVHIVPTASWVRPAFVEKLLKHGAAGVLIVRDARAERWARDGGRWVAERLERTRKPFFRPERAAGGAWAVVDFDVARPGELTRAADAFRGSTETGVRRRVPRRVKQAAAAAVLAVGLAAVTVAPSRLHVTNPASPEPELIFSFKALGEMVAAAPLDPVVEAAKPIHMRGRTTEKPQRALVWVRLTVDGVTGERSFAAKGVSHDGPALGEWRLPLSPGAHRVSVEVLPGPTTPAATWNGTITAELRKLAVLTYDPAGGFVRE